MASTLGLEKIKTIGDAYMVVGGVPVAIPNHAQAIAEMALDMQQAIRQIDHDGKPLQIRIGICSGPVVAGVIGFGFSQTFAVAVVMYLFASVFREARTPVYNAWMNQNVTSNVRATVFSMCNQADAIGQVLGGPLLGLIATAISLRISLLVSGLILLPVFFLYTYTIKKHKII
jgi:MFS family permease